MKSHTARFWFALGVVALLPLSVSATEKKENCSVKAVPGVLSTPAADTQKEACAILIANIEAEYMKKIWNSRKLMAESVAAIINEYYATLSPEELKLASQGRLERGVFLQKIAKLERHEWKKCKDGFIWRRAQDRSYEFASSIKCLPEKLNFSTVASAKCLVPSPVPGFPEEGRYEDCNVTVEINCKLDLSRRIVNTTVSPPYDCPWTVSPPGKSPREIISVQTDRIDGALLENIPSFGDFSELGVEDQQTVSYAKGHLHVCKSDICMSVDAFFKKPQAITAEDVMKNAVSFPDLSKALFIFRQVGDSAPSCQKYLPKLK